MNFGSALKRRRQERGLTQEALAELVPCSPQTIRKIEGSQRRPSYQMAHRLAQILQLAPEEQRAWMQAVRDEAEQAEQVPAAPPLASTRQLASQQALPAYVTPFIGREQECADVARLLGQPACRLLTILGPGGAGKTRLALQVAADAQADESRAVRFVALAPVAAPERVGAAIADVVGCPLSATAPVEESLLSFLRTQELLLVLDNLEHVLGAAPLLAAILREAPGVCILATSRERLRLQGEQIYELRGLATPEVGLGAPADRSEAALLFLERARHVVADFRLTPQNRAVVATICRLVDGMPLGIELASAWVRVLSLDEIAVEIERSLDFLASSDRDGDARHHSMRAVIDQSWALLTPEEQAVLARMAVFHGGCTREAAEQVAGVTLPVLAGLLDKSLVRRSQSGRYELHELVRQYAAARLAVDPATLAAVQARHAAYYTDWVATQEQQFTGAQHQAAFRAIAADIDNIRAVWQRATDQGDFRTLTRLSHEGLLWFYEVRGWYQEADRACGAAVATLRSAATASPEAEQFLGSLLGMQGWYAFRCGRPTVGTRLLDESIALLRADYRPIWRFNSLVQRTYVGLYRGEFMQVAPWLAELELLAELIDTPWQRGHVLVLQAAASVDRAPEQAYSLFRKHLPQIRAVQDSYLLALSLNYLGDAVLQLGRASEAEQVFEEARALSVELHNGITEVVALAGIARVAVMREAWREAVGHALHAVARSDEVGESWSRSWALAALGAAEHGAGDHPAARKTLAEAVRLSLAMGLIPMAVEAWVGLAALDLHDEARRAELLPLLAYVRTHPVAPARVIASAGRLLEQLAAQVGAPALAEAEAAARLKTPEQLLTLLAAYQAGAANPGRVTGDV